MAIGTTRQGRIIKGVAGKYCVKTAEGEILRCFARGKLRKDGELYVGDEVEVDDFGKECVIKEVLPRSSMLVRPYVSNIDGIVIVVSPLPKPDFLLVDKLIISCIHTSIIYSIKNLVYKLFSLLTLICHMVITPHFIIKFSKINNPVSIILTGLL